VAASVKGAYDDLHHAARLAEARDIMDDLEEPLLVRREHVITATTTSARSAAGGENGEVVESDNNVVETVTEQTELLNTSVAEASIEPRTVASAYMSAASGDRSTGSIMEGSQLVLPRRARLPVTRSRHMQRLFHLCTACYVVQIALIGGFVYGAIRYFPKIPTYSVCNDAVAWKSIIDSLTSLKPSADFEILGSISNPQPLDSLVTKRPWLVHTQWRLCGYF
jgi:hypothetical protein